MSLIDTATPTISVVIPLYNKRATIARALASITLQNVVGVEIIVVDDGSTDGSVEIVTALAHPDVRVIRQMNAGPGSARNTGASHARAELIAFLDADDEWTPDFLDSALAAFVRSPDALAYVSGYDAGEYRAVRPSKIAELGKLRGLRSLPLDAEGDVLKMHVDAMHSSCVVVRRSALADAGGFFTENGCRYGEDSWCWARLLFKGPVFWDPAELVIFHVEDSDIGYAVTHRTAARPISLYPERLSHGLPTTAAAASRRLSTTYALMDYHTLLQSHAWSAAANLRRLYRINGRLGYLKEMKRRLKSYVANVRSEKV